MPAMQRSVWMALASIAAFACADPPLDSGSTNVQLGDDARVGDGGSGGQDAAGMGGVGGGMGGVGGGMGGEGGAATDVGIPPDGDDGVPDPDMRVGPDPDAGPIGPERLVASIVLTEIPQVPSSSADVNVGEPVQLNDQPGCVVVAVDPGAQPPAPPPDWDAGDVTVSGVNGADLVFSLGGDGQYRTGGRISDDLFGNGSMLTATAAGGANMGAFQIQIAAPAQVTVSSPGFLAQHDRDRDLSVRWNAGGATTVIVTVFPSSGDGSPERGNWVFCGSPDTGSFTVPAAQLSQISPGGGFGPTAVVGVARTNVVTAGVGAHQAVFAVSSTGGQAFALSR